MNFDTIPDRPDHDYSPECASCGSHQATELREDNLLCEGCAHMIDAHGAHVYDAYAEDPCEAAR